MANTIRIRRRASGAAGAPSSLENAELAYNEVDNILYYGKGTGGAGGTATTIEAIAGPGAYVGLSGTQTITGNKTFSGTVTVATPSSDMHAATKKYVDDSITNAGGYAGFSATGDSGTAQAIDSGNTLTIAGGTGLSSVAGATDTITLNLDNTNVTAGSYGSSSSIPTFTVDAQGRLTAAGSVSISTSFTLTADSGSNQTVSGGDTLTIAGGTGIDTVASATDTLTINIDSTVATLTGTQELTNKTITSPTVSGLYLSDSSIVFEGSSADAYETTLTVTNPTADRTLTLPNATDTLVGKATTDTFTNKTFDTAGTGNHLSINGNAIESYVGSGANVVLSSSPTITNLNASGLYLTDSSITFEGSTDDTYETTLAVTDPTADRTITLPNATGTVALTSDLPTSMSVNVYGDSGVTSFATTTAGSGSFTISGGTGLTADATSSTITVNLDNTAVNAGTYGSSTAVGVFVVDAQGRLTTATSTSIRTATTSQTGLASFSSGDFAVTTGEVTIKSGGVDNAQLANSTITLGSSTLTLGSTTTSVAGLTELQVDNINFNGNEISTTDTNGNLSLNPAGTGSVTVNGHKITNLGTPVDDADAATKGYVDNKVTGLSWKQAVHALASSNVPLTGSTPLEIDGHTVLDTERVLLIGQTTTADKGIYDVAISGGSYTLTRSSDANVYTELHGLAVFVQVGNSYANTGWVQTADNLTSFSGQTWTQFSGAGAYGAGSGLGLDGTTFNINVDANGGIEISGDALTLKSTVGGAGLTLTSGVLAVGGTADKITVNADAITIASTYAGQSSITTVGTIATGTWNGNTIAIANGGTGSTTASEARTALGLAIGTDVQQYNANLAAIAGLTSAANALPYFTGSGAAAVTTLSSFIRGLLDDADAATARTTLGVDSYTIDGGTF